MITLNLSGERGHSVLGTAVLGPRFHSVQVGKTVPSLQTGEDATALARCAFIDPTLPIEVNLLESRNIQRALLRRRIESFDVPDQITPEQLLTTHPSLGYVPPEVLSSPNRRAVHALSSSGPVGSEIANLWNAEGSRGTAEDRPAVVGDGTFWLRLSKVRALYGRWLDEIASGGRRLRIGLLAPPTAVLSSRFPNSGALQAQLNIAASRLLTEASGDHAPIYSFHLEPSALDDVELLLTARRNLDLALASGEGGFYGVHLHFTSLGTIALSAGARVRAAQDLVKALASTTRSHDRFLWVSGTGSASPAFLDEGAAFAAYAPGAHMRLAYPLFRASSSLGERPPSQRMLDRYYGKVLAGPWDLTLLSRSDLREREWTVQPNGRFPHSVPVGLRDGDPELFRVEFGKPNNIAVMEKVNEERERELVVRNNHRPGKDAVGKSSDATTTVWAY